MDPLMKLKTDRGVRTVQERMQALTAYLQKPESGRNPAELARFLCEEILESEDSDWAGHCASLLKDTVHQHGLESHAFLDVSALVFELMGNRVTEDLRRSLDLLSVWIPKGDPQILEWLEAQLDSSDSNWRSFCRRKLAELEIENLHTGEQDNWDLEEIGILEWQEMNTREKLNWLASFEESPVRTDVLRHLGMQFLALEQDRFVLSRLARVLPEVYSQTAGPLPCLWIGFLEHSDARVRSNALEGMVHWLDSAQWGVRIASQIDSRLQDRDTRVRIASLKLIYARDSKRCFHILGEMLRSCSSEEELESLVWLLRFLEVLELWTSDVEAARHRCRERSA